MNAKANPPTHWVDCVGDEIDKNNPAAAAALLCDILREGLPQERDTEIVEELYGCIVLLNQLESGES
jgi:hypothetical protein